MKNAKKNFISEKVQKYRKCPALLESRGGGGGKVVHYVRAGLEEPGHKNFPRMGILRLFTTRWRDFEQHRISIRVPEGKIHVR